MVESEWKCRKFLLIYFRLWKWLSHFLYIMTMTAIKMYKIYIHTLHLHCMLLPWRMYRESWGKKSIYMRNTSIVIPFTIFCMNRQKSAISLPYYVIFYLSLYWIFLIHSVLIQFSFSWRMVVMEIFLFVFWWVQKNVFLIMKKIAIEYQQCIMINSNHTRIFSYKL